ncbi:class I SAM-dependent methyltransferase [Argonema galeatum]|uniref:class I SAM-dependent methyltransferase n=1 Tax=Argonema galeatum TaxID=2942762 RepID=UPI002012DB5F|nr:methyltransferase domain-containing protein [Argonema galeatum]MCL1467695.1 methyltransferase domain-containing protein [Argonema galeatum A003/A1]
MSVEKKLHIGCFDCVYPGWINTDITPHIFISKFPGLPFVLHRSKVLSNQRYQQHQQGIFSKVEYLDVGKKFPWPNETFSCAYTSHMMEHLYRETALNCISEVFRVLKKGGIFRVVVPDLDEMIKSYDPQDPEFFLTGFFEANEKLEKNRHHWHYNEKLLRKILLNTGFQEVIRCNYKEGRLPEVEVMDNRPNSLFMEAIK